MPATSQQNAASTTPQGAPAHLRQVLTLWDLIFYGMVLIQPVAGIPLFGVAQKLSNGHTVTTILIAMLAMVITAVSYGRMAAVHPSAGSAYTYVGRAINPHLGFLIGWAMLLDYILQPLINVVWISVALHSRYITFIPFPITALAVTVFITALNLVGIRSSARLNKLLLLAMCVVIAFFFVLGIHYLYHRGQWPALFSITPFYDPKTFDIRRIWGATSFAALTYIGFDGITTLSEEVKNPRRNVLLATVLVCVFTGLLSGAQIYLGQRIWPNWHTFPNLETAFMDVCRRVGGPLLFEAMGVVLILAALGSALTGGLGAARLLFGMGRDGVLPRRFFAHLDPKTDTPTWNILLIGAVAWLGAVALNSIGSAYEHAGELLNFGAFLAFMGVNLAVFWHFTLLRRNAESHTPDPSQNQESQDQRNQNHRKKIMRDAVLPLIGFLFCASIWWNLNILARIVGSIWFLAGAAYLVATTNFFRNPPRMIDFRES